MLPLKALPEPSRTVDKAKEMIISYRRSEDIEPRDLKACKEQWDRMWADVEARREAREKAERLRAARKEAERLRAKMMGETRKKRRARDNVDLRKVIARKTVGASSWVSAPRH